MTKAQKIERDEAIASLREVLKPGDTVYTILRHVSKSGMMRVIQVVKVADDGSMLHLGWNVGKAIDYRYDREREGLRVTGCGMDMGFSITYHLGRVLFPQGFPVAGRGRNGDTSGHDTDGGYALNHRWL